MRSLVALFGLLAMLLASSVEASHIHGDWLPHHDAQVGATESGSLLGGEAGCPLCVAMHSAAAARLVRHAAPASAFDLAVALPVLHRPTLLWHFARFSRPPPVAGL